MLPCVIFEDDHLLVVNKPSGLNTHAPSPWSGEGIYDWLRHREPRWASLAIIHRLDKETSGLLVFGKTKTANRSLTDQFAGRAVRKRYVLLTGRRVQRDEFSMRTALVRAGERYISRPIHAGAEMAETKFRVLPAAARPGLGGQWIEAEPVTGRTHQIRVHAAESGIPILGDALYGGAAATRLCLHAAELEFKHPVTAEKLTFKVPANFQADPALELRKALIEPELTNANRLIHGASDREPGWYVDQLGDFLLAQSAEELNLARRQRLKSLETMTAARGCYHKILSRRVGRSSPLNTSPQPVAGQRAPDRFVIRENGIRYEMSLVEGYSAGLFLDQRDNRRRMLTGHVAAGFSLFASAPVQEGGKFAASTPIQVLNLFAYTCGFSVCAAAAGARTTSIDLSRKYLAWGKRNFELNNLDPALHSFLYGDVFDWLRRLTRKPDRFDLILVDPPTFSQSKESGVFQVEKHLGKLVAAVVPLLKRGGVLFASSNAAEWSAEQFLRAVEGTIHEANILQRHYAPQPPDFPTSPAEKPYLKTVWLRVGDSKQKHRL